MTVSDRNPRVLVKLSGEALMGGANYGIALPAIEAFATDLVSLSGQDVETAVVVGGGNIFRGMAGVADGMDRVTADHMGMLATVMNGLALGAAVNAAGGSAAVMSAIAMEGVCDGYDVHAARRALSGGRIVIAAGGTGNPFFTTDTAAILRAVELQCDGMMKATQVDGVYAEDPKTNADAARFDTISYDEVLKNGLKVMDAAAIGLARDNAVPVSVFRLEADGRSITEAWHGRRPLTRVTA